MPVSIGTNPYSPTSVDFKNFIANNVGVPNYAAKIALQIENLRVSYGDSVRFHVEVSSVGTAQVQYLSYELVVAAPNGTVYVLFPQNGPFPLKGGWVPIAGIGVPGATSDTYIPFQTFDSGKGFYDKVNGNDYANPTTFWYTGYIWLRWDLPSDATLIRNYLGTWTVYVFVFATLAQSTQSPTNAISYTTDTFQIVPLSPATPWYSSLSNLFKAFSLLFASTFAWFAVYPRVVRNWWRIQQLRGRRLDLVVVILVVALFISAWVTWLLSFR